MRQFLLLILLFSFSNVLSQRYVETDDLYFTKEDRKKRIVIKTNNTTVVIPKKILKRYTSIELKNDSILYEGDTFALTQSPNGIFLGITVDRAKGKGGAETSSGGSVPEKLGFKGMADTLYMDKKYFMKFLKEMKKLKI